MRAINSNPENPVVSKNGVLTSKKVRKLVAGYNMFIYNLYQSTGGRIDENKLTYIEGRMPF